MSEETTLNGTPEVPTDDAMLARLLADMTAGYKPSLPIAQFYAVDGTPQFFLYRDLPQMLTHPHVGNVLRYVIGGIAGAEFEAECENTEVAEWGIKQMRKFWDRGVPKLQQGGYSYGWCGAENLYDETEGRLEWDDLVDFHPRDTFLLTQDQRHIGIRVKHLIGCADGQVDLWFAEDNIPAKGLWYAHDQRFNSTHGTPQVLLAWRPWRRLATVDAAESITDLALYRHGVNPPIGRFPSESYKLPTTQAGPAGLANPFGVQYEYARDAMRKFLEQFKSGAVIALPSDKYPPERGGDWKWMLDFPESTINVDGLLGYIDYLKNEISYGVGFPPELLEAAESGSGYSGRAIPLEAFLATQQRFADAFCRLFLQQVLRPLILRNFGDVRFNITVKNLLQTKKMAAAGLDPTQKQPPGQFPQMGAQPGQPQIPSWLQNGSGGGPVSFSLEAAKQRILQIKGDDKARLEAGYRGLQLLSLALGNAA